MVALIAKRLDIFFKVVEWALFLGLCSASYFAISGVWEQYQSYGSNFYKSSKQTLFDKPTLVIYLSNNSFEYGNDFTLSYSTSSPSEKIDKRKELNKGINIIQHNNAKIQVKYEELKFPSYDVTSIHKITSDFISKSEWTRIAMHLNKSSSPQKLPTVTISLTSEKNAYGVFHYEDYYEGQELSKNNLEFGTEIWIKVQPEKYISLDKSQSPKSFCEHNKSFYESFDTLLTEEIFKNCGSQCLPYSSIIHSIPICKREDELFCAFNIFSDLRIKDTFLQKCVSSCSITQYVKTYEWIGNWKPVQSEATTYDFSFYYALAKNETKVFEEYLIHDLMSMIGSVGGTLGLFIGFSFNNIVSHVIYQIRKCLFHAIAKIHKINL